MTERVGLLGWPVEHSVSPPMHSAAFAALGLDWRYDLLPVPPEELEDRLPALIAEGYRGFNVTVPHKNAILSVGGVRFRVDDAVMEIGATNTLTVEADGWVHAANTDWQGFADDLRAHGVEVAGRRCLILGTGGSARAVAHALRRMDAGRVTFVSRRPGWLARRTIPYGKLGRVAPTVDLIVNCTPVGMSPHVDASPWPEDVPLPEDAVLYDLIYNPPVTRLIAQARAAGLQTIGGLGMLVRQGALAFERWTGLRPPLEVMEQAARQALERT